LIKNIRLEIVELNEKLFLTLDDNDEFTSILNESVISEEILKKHEDKLQDLRLRYEEFKSLYEKINVWNQLWETFVIFDKKASDPNRFRAKGYNSLQEEKQRKEFRLKFAKLEEELSVLASSYKTCYNRDLSIKGQNISEYLSKIKNSYEANRKIEKKSAIQVSKNGMQRVNSLRNENCKRMSFARTSLMIPPNTPIPSRVSSAAFGANTSSTPKSATRITAEKIAKRSRDSFYKKTQTPQRPIASETSSKQATIERSRFQDISNQKKA
jgi:Ni,Fe-hydrogenase I large subunit